jgi:glycosyltransferase A (GT-A) superfamily protein (DUF2064 family)
LVGLARRRAAVFEGVPMSTRHTARDQLARLTSRGCRVGLVSVLRDVDHFDDALAVADDMPADSRFARTVREIAAAVATNDSRVVT